MKPTILIVEDASTMRSILSDLVSIAGCDPLLAADAASALRIASTTDLSGVIVDFSLPDMNGAEFLRALRSSHLRRLRSVRAIAISGRAENRDEMLKAGACCFLKKPIGSKQLADALASALSAP